MKTYLFAGVIALVLLIPNAGASINLLNEKATSKQTTNSFNTNTKTSAFTHSVFAEYTTATTCGPCVSVSARLYAIYQSQSYPFYYVTLVMNKNDAAKNRYAHYRVPGVPSVFFDGGYKNITGAVGDEMYRSLIQDSGARTVHPIGIQLSATEVGSAKIKITVTVKNNGSFFYIGGVLGYVTEIISRWYDKEGNPYHYTCLDLPIKKPLFLFPKGKRTFTVTWDGADKGFDDIDTNNIMILASVSHWKAHQEVGYDNTKFTAYYVDQAAGSLVTN